MADIHALYAARSIGKFRSFLRGGGGGSGAGGGGGGGGGGGPSSLSRSPGYGGGGGGGMGSAAMVAEVNRRDHLGRTVLHLAVVELAEWALDWVELLLASPAVQVNAVDLESGWTALHRALYVGNIAAARLLLTRSDIDSRSKDHEGLSPFDVYNSTVEGTNPSEAALARRELFTWGANRNFVLGFSGDGDRVAPERVQLLREEGGKGLEAYEPLRIKDVSMARLHTGIVTDEKRSNVRLCGYGTGGRLGQTTQTQFTFAQLRDFPYTVASVVLSPDHTVVITTDGDVYTFGLNRAAQLGYVLEGPPADEPIQFVPRRIVGVLKKEVVLGGAASRMHTAVFTSDALYTWGTNRGQLGYAISGADVQIIPRKVTAITLPIVQLSATENATACLLKSQDVVVLYHEGYIKITFPLARFPSKMQAYRPPQVSSKPNIEKISSCGNTFAALSSLGDVFTFSMDASTSKSGTDSPGALARATPKPQRIWSIRRKFTAVTDVGVGLDGSIILCTVSGHVFVRTKRFETAALTTKNPGGGGGGWKFSRVPYLQRVVKVAANSTGGFAAIRADVPLRPVEVAGPTLAENLLGILPHWRRVEPVGAKFGSRAAPAVAEADDEDEGDPDAWIDKEVEVALQIFKVLDEWDDSWEESMAGSDLHVHVGRLSIPVHRLILSQRSSILAHRIADNEQIDLACSEVAALLLVHYIYSDEVASIWQFQVGSRVREVFPQAIVDFGAVKVELSQLALEFGLSALATSLEHHLRTPPAPTLTPCIAKLMTSGPNTEADIVLELADRDVRCQSVILRARCTVFSTFYDDLDWTASRKEDGLIRFDLKHVEWDVMSVVLSHIYSDAGEEMFGEIEHPTSDEYIDYVTRVLAVANELLLDKLKLICASVLRRFVTLHNVCAILVDAAFYEAKELVQACMLFLVSSMETVLEGRLLDDLPPDLITAVSKYCQERQGARMPISRSGLLVSELLVKHASWYADLDLAKPTGGAKKWKPHAPRSPGPPPCLLSPGPSPHLGPSRVSPRLTAQLSPNSSPSLQPSREMDEPFSMDDDFTLDVSPSRPPLSSSIGSYPPAARRASTSQTNSPSAVSFMTLGSPPPSRLHSWTRLPAEPIAAPLGLRGIMASEAAASRPKIAPSESPRGSTSQLKPTTPGFSPSARASVSSAPLSWRPVDAAKPSLASIQSEQRQQPSRASPEPTRLSAQRPPLAPIATPLSPTASPSATNSPVITPQRSAKRVPSGIRPPPAASFGAADVPWTNYTVAPPSPVLDPFVVTSSSPSRQSFASIQSQQRAEVDAFKSTKAPRSFAEVMAQEAAEIARKAEEEEFERWWAAESERVRLAEAGHSGGRSTPSNRGSGAKRGGRGGGGGRAGGASDGGGGRGGSAGKGKAAEAPSGSGNASSTPKAGGSSGGQRRRGRGGAGSAGGAGGGGGPKAEPVPV